MARGRMVDKDISTSETINALSVKSAFIYTWLQLHMDDYGYIPKSALKLKAIVFPMKKEIALKDIEKTIKEGLVINQNGKPLIVELSDCYQLPGAAKRQSISKPTKTKFEAKKTVSPKNPPESPEIPKIPQESPKQQNRTEEKGREGKRTTTELKGIEQKLGGVNISKAMLLLDVFVKDHELTKRRAYFLAGLYPLTEIEKAVKTATTGTAKNPTGLLISLLEKRTYK